MPDTDAIDILIIVGWCYLNGFIFAWLIEPLAPQVFIIAAWFALIGLICGVFGIERRRRTGRFPLGISLVVFGLPFLCSFVGGVFWLVVLVQSWLGVI